MLANIKNRRIRESVGEFMKIKIEIFNNLDTIARAHRITHVPIWYLLGGHHDRIYSRCFCRDIRRVIYYGFAVRWS